MQQQRQCINKTEQRQLLDDTNVNVNDAIKKIFKINQLVTVKVCQLAVKLFHFHFPFDWTSISSTSLGDV